MAAQNSAHGNPLVEKFVAKLRELYPGPGAPFVDPSVIAKAAGINLPLIVLGKYSKFQKELRQHRFIEWRSRHPLSDCRIIGTQKIYAFEESR